MNQDLSRWQRFVNTVAPFYRLWRNEQVAHAATRAELAERDVTIGELRIDLTVETARTRLANEQRDRARDLAGALMGETEFSAGDAAWLGDHEIGAE